MIKAFWTDERGCCDDYLETDNLTAARDWLAAKVEAFRPDGPARWAADGLSVDCEWSWEDKVPVYENLIPRSAFYENPSQADLDHDELNMVKTVFYVRGRGEIRHVA
jgi:hypothetical protein